jgi:tripartite-type tricarboxylate transporter receptor subunit TctC
MKTTTRRITIAGLASVLAGISTLAGAQDFPTRPIRIIVPYAPGGIPDPITRALAPHMAQTLGQPVTVENKPGGGGVPAISELLRAPADGHLLVCADAGQWAIQPALKPGVFDPAKDFVALGMVATSIIFVTVREDLPVKSFQDLVALAKSKPGQLSYGTSGIGSIHQLFMETVKAQFGMDIVHVPFKGAAASIGALVAGDIPIVIASNGSLAPHLKAGKVRRLLAATTNRSRSAPDVPSTADVAMTDSFPGDEGYIVRSGTPKAIVDKLAFAVARAAATPEFAKITENLYVDVTYLTPAQMEERMRIDQVRYAKAIRLAGVKPE